VVCREAAESQPRRGLLTTRSARQAHAPWGVGAGRDTARQGSVTRKTRNEVRFGLACDRRRTCWEVLVRLRRNSTCLHCEPTPPAPHMQPACIIIIVALLQSRAQQPIYAVSRPRLPASACTPYRKDSLSVACQWPVRASEHPAGASPSALPAIRHDAIRFAACIQAQPHSGHCCVGHWMS
jgi:hypothetical protein